MEYQKLFKFLIIDNKIQGMYQEKQPDGTMKYY